MITGIILTGGKSSRFFKQSGEFKQFALIDGHPMIIHSLRKLEGICEKIFISVHSEIQQQLTNQYISKYEFAADIEYIQDKKEFGDINDFQNLGPLTGILSCLSSIEKGKVIITAVDTPLIPKSVMQDMFNNLDHCDILYIKCNDNSRFLNIAIDIGKMNIEYIKKYLINKQVLGLRLRPSDLFLASNCFGELIYKNNCDLFVNINTPELINSEINLLDEKLEANLKIYAPNKTDTPIKERLLFHEKHAHGILKAHITRDLSLLDKNK